MDGITERTEASSMETDLEGEDFLSRLTAEERECLQYLLETIDSLDADDHDEEQNANTTQDIRTGLSRSLDSDGNITKTLKGLNDGSAPLDKTEHDPSPTKMKIIKSFSEDCPGCSITVTPELAPRSSSSHPSHLRKFDTIMRSGVNVQELRARFIHHQDNSSIDDNSRGSDLSAASKQLPQVSRNQKSPRQEALQKLGLLKRKQSNPNNFPETTSHGKDRSSSPNQHTAWAGNSQHSLEGAESQDTLTKLDLLKF
ncbi:uncharacterized protein O3C94_013774 isoform 1-T2 [Discoglossus pictus]